jgi:L-ascorbate metabolism protein UlaG (beta-lactamase superfamily)
MSMGPESERRAKLPQTRRRLPKSFKDLTPSQTFSPHVFFYEMVWKAWRTRRFGTHQTPVFPPLTAGQVGITWIGHASFLIQFKDLNIAIDPNFANWLFIVKRLRRSGLRIKDLPPIDLVLVSHAHFDHFHKPSIRRLRAPKIGIMPWGMGKLTRGLGFERVLELEWWESFCHGDWKVTLTPSKHWGARVLHDSHLGYGGFVLEHQGRRIYHAGDTAYFEGFKEIGRRCPPEIALLPIGAYHPEGMRRVHMGPEEAIRAFKDIKAKYLIPMHYGSFKLSFEGLQEPPRRLKEIAHKEGLTPHLRILEEGIPALF